MVRTKVRIPRRKQTAAGKRLTAGGRVGPERAFTPVGRMKTAKGENPRSAAGNVRCRRIPARPRTARRRGPGTPDERSLPANDPPRAASDEPGSIVGPDPVHGEKTARANGFLQPRVGRRSRERRSGMVRRPAAADRTARPASAEGKENPTRGDRPLLSREKPRVVATEKENRPAADERGTGRSNKSARSRALKRNTRRRISPPSGRGF